ncbi:MAG: nucleotide exchange factor GrpE [Chloroflexota bacterium]
MSEHRQVWETIARLLQRVEKSSAEAQNIASEPPILEQEVRKMGKTQHKANLLAEEQITQLKQALTLAQSAQEQNVRLLNSLNAELTAGAQKDTLEAILPALDGLEHAIASGQRYLKTRDLAASGLANRNAGLTEAQAILVSPADRAMLAGWLDGLNLVRERLLAILETGGVTPLDCIGQAFDPYQHVAVGTTAQLSPGMPILPNHIVSEEQRGYRSPAGVIRFAEVIVYRPI